MTLISRAYMFLGISERSDKKPREGERQGQEEWDGEKIAGISLPLSQSQEEGGAGLNAGILFSTLRTR